MEFIPNVPALESFWWRRRRLVCWKNYPNREGIHLSICCGVSRPGHARLNLLICSQRYLEGIIQNTFTNIGEPGCFKWSSSSVLISRVALLVIFPKHEHPDSIPKSSASMFLSSLSLYLLFSNDCPRILPCLLTIASPSLRRLSSMYHARRTNSLPSKLQARYHRQKPLPRKEWNCRRCFLRCHRKRPSHLSGPCMWELVLNDSW